LLKIAVVENNALGGWAIGVELFTYIKTHLKEGSRILEFGSGTGSVELKKSYGLISIEHNEEWYNKGKDNKWDIIHCPIVDGWYDTQALDWLKQSSFDLILIDGPPAAIGRKGILDHMDLLDAPIIIVDDTHRLPDMTLAEDIASVLDIQTKHVKEHNKQFTVLTR